MTSPKVLFAGTPEFALSSLRAIVDAGTRPIAVLTQPDRPAGRGKRLTASPVKEYALQAGIDVLQPATLKNADVVAELAALSCDLMIVAAYGLILPQDVLDLPTYGCVNVHASLLPRWRGAAPIQAAILNGDPETGVSLMSMTAGLDCGPVYVMKALPIGADETAGELHDRLADLGGRLLVQHLDAIVAGDFEAVEQDEFTGRIMRRKSANRMLSWTGVARRTNCGVSSGPTIPVPGCLVRRRWPTHQVLERLDTG